jgi:hypothetical protein
MDLAIAISAGNPGAISVVVPTLKAGHRDTLERCLSLDITGPKIWILYKDMGDQTIETFVDNVAAEDVKEKLAALGY